MKHNIRLLLIGNYSLYILSRDTSTINDFISTLRDCWRAKEIRCKRHVQQPWIARLSGTGNSELKAETCGACAAAINKPACASLHLINNAQRRSVDVAYIISANNWREQRWLKLHDRCLGMEITAKAIDSVIR